MSQGLFTWAHDLTSSLWNKTNQLTPKYRSEIRLNIWASSNWQVSQIHTQSKTPVDLMHVLLFNFTFGKIYFWTSTKYLNWYQMFQPWSIWFVFCCCCFCDKNIFGTFDLLFIFPLLSTYLTYYSLPAVPTSQPLFFLPQCLPCEPWTKDLCFSFGFMSWCLTSEPRDLDASSPIF